jgi:hypothetical protein
MGRRAARKTRAVRWAVVVLGGIWCFGFGLHAEESRSAPLAKELAALMTQQKLDAFAAKNPNEPNMFVAALLFPGVQLLVVAGQPIAPAATQVQLDQKQYADIYTTLQQAVVPESKIFFQDLKADGLHAKSPDAVDILYERVVTQTMFDGNPSKHHLTDAQYQQKFAAADAQYSQLLAILIDSLKQPRAAFSGEDREMSHQR